MTGKEIQKKEMNTIIPSNQIDAFSNFTDMARKMKDEPVFEPRCKLCKSEHRAEAEKEYERVKNYAAVHRFLVSQKHMDISEPAVKVHLREHYGKEVRIQQLKEYAEDLNNNWLKVHQSTEEKLTHYLALIDMRIHTLAAVTDKTDPDAMRKTNDSIAKLIEQACKIEERLQKMRESTQPVNILIDKFKNIILVQSENIKSAEARSVLTAILDAVQKEIEEVDVNV